MTCDKCKRRVGMAAISVGKCVLCGTDIFSGNMPPPILCDNCSNTEGLCSICKKSQWKQMSFDDLKGEVLY